MRRYTQVKQQPVHLADVDVIQQLRQLAEIAVNESDPLFSVESSPALIQRFKILIDSNEDSVRFELLEERGRVAATPQGGIDIRTTSVGN